MFAFASGRYPGNPPLWGELYTVARAGGSGAWEMSRLPKGARPDESSGEHEYNALLVKHSMISRACRATLAERDEPDLAELIYKDRSVTTAQLQATYCEPLCAAGTGAPLKDEV